MKRIFPLSLLFPAVAIFYTCSQSQDLENLELQRQALHQKGQRFYCDLQHLGEESKELWDSVAYSLERELPQDMPAKERKNMVDIRNADLIRMFEAFPKLPPEIQQSVAEAEKEDQNIAGRMRALNDSLKQHDAAVSHFLEIVNLQLPDSLQSWQERLLIYSCNQ